MIITQDEAISNFLIITVLLFNYFLPHNFPAINFLEQRFINFVFMEEKIQNLSHIIQSMFIVCVIHLNKKYCCWLMIMFLFKNLEFWKCSLLFLNFMSFRSHSSVFNGSGLHQLFNVDYEVFNNRFEFTKIKFNLNFVNSMYLRDMKCLCFFFIF